jgi:hypothetical protein
LPAALSESSSMNKQIGLKILLVAALAITGCRAASSADSRETAVPRFSHPREITNPYLPLSSLSQDVLENESERVERTAKPEVRKNFRFAGQMIEALAVEDREFKNGQLAEVTLDYFAQSDDGAVYYLGEDVDEYRDGKITGHSGAWLLGKQTQTPGLLMPAHPKVGDKFRSEDVPHVTWEEDEVFSVSETATVPAGIFQNCVKIREKLSDGATEYKLYAPGVGRINDDELLLKSHTPR